MKPSLRFSLIIALTLLLSACGLDQQARGKKASPDWSRAMPLEGTPSGQMDVLLSGGHLHLVWPELAGGKTSVRYTRLDFPAQVGESRVLEVGEAAPRHLRLVALPGERYALVWAFRLPGHSPWGLRALLLDSAGQPQGEPLSLLPATLNLLRFDALSLPDGRVFLVWHQTEPEGIFTALWNPSRGELSSPQRLAERGTSPAVQADRRGGLHLAWQEGQEMKYAFLPSPESAPPPPVTAARLPAGTGVSISPVSLGLSEGRVYLFWSVLNRSGMEAGSGYTAYVSFPAAQPETGVPQRLLISASEAPPYRPAEVWPGITLLAPPVTQAESSDFILSPALPRGEREALLLAVSVRQDYRLDAHQQIAVGLLREGNFEGYAFATLSPQLSDEPHLALDAEGYAHLLWREGAFGQRVFYATNEPQARARLDRLTSADFVNALLEGSLESATGMLLLPIVGFGWLLPGLVLLGGWKLFRDDESIRDWASRGALLLALLLYQAVKWISLPSMVVYVPFSAWLDIPLAWRVPLQVSVPVATLAAGVAAARRVARRRNPSTLLFYLVTGLVDALLTLAVYGVILLGVY